MFCNKLFPVAREYCDLGLSCRRQMMRSHARLLIPPKLLCHVQVAIMVQMLAQAVATTITLTKAEFPQRASTPTHPIRSLENPPSIIGEQSFAANVGIAEKKASRVYSMPYRFQGSRTPSSWHRGHGDHHHHHHHHHHHNERQLFFFPVHT